MLLPEQPAAAAGVKSVARMVPTRTVRQREEKVHGKSTPFFLQPWSLPVAPAIGKASQGSSAVSQPQNHRAVWKGVFDAGKQLFNCLLIWLLSIHRHLASLWTSMHRKQLQAAAWQSATSFTQLKTFFIALYLNVPAALSGHCIYLRETVISLSFQLS